MDIHILFAEEDDYYLDSLLRLDLKHYLSYQLQKQGFSYVYFLEYNGTERRLFGLAETEKLTVRCLDEKTGQFFTDGTSRFRQPLQEEKFCFSGEKEEIAGSLAAVLSTSGRSCAAVMQLKDAHILFSVDEVRQLLRQKTANTAILVLTADHRAEHSFPELKQLFSLFPDLFPELRFLALAPVTERFYLQLKNTYQSRMQVWDTASIQSTERLLSRMELEGAYCGEKDRKHYYAVILSAALRGIRGPSLHEPDFPDYFGESLKQLREELAAVSRWTELDRAVEAIGDNRNAWSLLTERIKEYSDSLPYRTEIPELRDLRRKMDQVGKAYGITWGESTESGFQRLKAGTTIQWCGDIDFQGIGEKILRCMESIDTCKEQIRKHPELMDYCPVTIGMNSVLLHVNQRIRGEETEIFQIKADTYESMIRSAAMLMEYQQLIDNNLSEIQKQQKIFAACMEQIDAIKTKYAEELKMDSIFSRGEKDKIRSLEGDMFVCKNQINRCSNHNQILHEYIKNTKDAMNVAKQSILSVEKSSRQNLGEHLKKLNQLLEEQNIAGIREGKDLLRQKEALDILQEERLAQEKDYGIQENG